MNEKEREWELIAKAKKDIEKQGTINFSETSILAQILCVLFNYIKSVSKITSKERLNEVVALFLFQLFQEKGNENYRHFLAALHVMQEDYKVDLNKMISQIIKISESKEYYEYMHGEVITLMDKINRV